MLKIFHLGNATDKNIKYIKYIIYTFSILATYNVNIKI